MDQATSQGLLEVVKFPCNFLYFEMVCWLYYNRPSGCTKDAVQEAAERDHIRSPGVYLKKKKYQHSCDHWIIDSSDHCFGAAKEERSTNRSQELKPIHIYNKRGSPFVLFFNLVEGFCSKTVYTQITCQVLIQ